MPDDDIDLETVSPWLLRIELDRETMIDKKLSIINIVDKIKYEFGSDLTCMYADDNADKLILRVRMIKHEKEVPREGREDDFAQDDLFLKQIESFMLAKMSICGIPGISKAFIKSGKVTKFNRNEGFITDVEWMLDTEGVNLLEVLCNDDVDASRTTSNHLIEVIEVLGIEAVRRTLLHELREVLSFDGSYVNYRHLAILCDLMTHKGYLMAISRHGVNKNDTGPLMRCSFEETAMILLNAAAYAETDPVGGVSENIMLGQLAPVGTGACELYLNTEMLKQAMDTDLPSYTDCLGDAMKTTCSQLSAATPCLPSPSYLLSPNAESSPFGDARFSPYISGLTSSPFRTTYQYDPVPPTYSPVTPPYSPFNTTPNSYNPISPVYDPVSPVYNPLSPVYSSASPVHGSMSPVHGSLAPRYAPASPVYDSPSPSYRPASPYYSPTTPVYSPSSPVYSPYSSLYSPHDPSVPSYSPTSPLYSPTAPSYSPMSPQYTPSSPIYSPNSADSNPASQIYSPTSPQYSPTSPDYSLAHDTEYSPTSPQYSPTSPDYSLAHDTEYSPTSPGYSPTSPSYSPNVQN
jgi:DNA-directed RNA polymerase II subunit RPB1